MNAGRVAPTTPAECVERARRLAPRVAERAALTETGRTLPDETIGDLVESGLIRTLLPARYGGSELDFDVVLSVCLELGRACATTAWVGSFFMNHAWVVGLFPLAAQDEVWSSDRDALVATRVSLHGNVVERGSDAWTLTGTWPQTSGVDHAQWVVLGASASQNDRAERFFCLVPKRDLRIVDTWRAVGVRGSGSHTVIAEKVLVPAHRVIPFQDFMDGTCPGGAIAGAGPLYRLPASGGYMPILAGPILGTARGVLDACVEAGKRVRGGPGSLGVTQRASLAEAAAEIDSVTSLLHWHLRDSMATVARGATMTLAQRARGRRDGAHAAKVCNRAMTRLLDFAPAFVLYDTSPVQRAWRDVRMMSAHPALHADTVGELWTSVSYDLPLPDSASTLL
jgi:3-hydroxy-9,10-secoandrosta-1,3,5(10)-triene-9,17-dione monooxygenase